MTVSIDTEQAAQTATILEVQERYFDNVTGTVTSIGSAMDITEFTSPAASLSRELAQEFGLVAGVLRARISMAVAADSGGFSLRGYERAAEGLDEQLALLDRSTSDGVGATGSADDARGHLVRVVLGNGTDASPPPGVDPAQWEAENIAGPLLDDATPEQVAAYWGLLGDDGQVASIVFATPSVSDRYQGGDLTLDDDQVILLQVQPIPTTGRRPASGRNTDWAGVDIPRLPPIDRPEAPESEWVYDQELRSFAGGSLLCSGIQLASIIPSKPSSEPVQGAVDWYGVYRDARNVQVPIGTAAKAFPLTAILGTIADLGLCRLGVGSGYHIDTTRVVTEEGQVVYAGSRSPTQPYMDLNGLPLSPNPRQRDEQMWRAEHNLADGTWEAYPGFPVYDVNADGYEG